MYKMKPILLGLLFAFSLPNLAKSQMKLYSTSGGEIIFSQGQLAYTSQYAQQYQDAEIVNAPLRFTLFFHFGHFAHLDLNNNIGFYSGIGMRNVGIISNEVLPVSYSTPNQYQDIKVIRRFYSLGVPLAIKVGSFKNNFYVYSGGEIDWAFHYKEKYWESHSRSGAKKKYNQWWPSQVETLQPSVFLGVQLPKGLNVKLKYYLTDVLDHTYKRNSAVDAAEVVSDLTKYKESKLFYVSISWFFKPKKYKKSAEDSGEVAVL